MKHNKIKIKGGKGLEFILDHELMYIDGTKRAGLDYLYEHCFEGINNIVSDNLKGEHNTELIEGVYKDMLQAMEKASIKMKQYKDNTKSWYKTHNNILEYSRTAATPNKKVIVITMVDQFLRSTY